MTVEEQQRHTARELDPNNDLPVIAPSQTFETVSEQISSIVLKRKTPPAWWWVFGVGMLLLLSFVVSVSYLVTKGVGIWGVQIPVAWGFAITNFVWWIGIGHAGTLI
ncbi:MAG: hydrogenase, partial [Acidobacteriaceae bacterium]|nr:hydrogenase [Acidobacteriaceae bacterium]